jgi:fibrillarin-like rRNA methylase
MAKNDQIQINCKYEDYVLIHRAMVAAAKQARRDGNDQLNLALGNVLLRLGSSEGLTSFHLSDINLWDVD